MRTKMLFLWFILALVATTASMAGNRVSVLHNGYVTPIDGYEFLPGATDSGKRKVGSTVTLVEGKNTYLIADPGMAAKGAWPKILAELALRGTLVSLRPRGRTAPHAPHNKRKSI